MSDEIKAVSKTDRLLSQVVQWHPRFHVSRLKDGQLLLLPDMESGIQPLLLPAMPYGELFGLRRPSLLAELVEKQPELVSPTLFYQFQQLLEAELLVKAGSKNHQDYITPCLQQPFVRLDKNQSNPFVLISCSQYINAETVSPLLEGLQKLSTNENQYLPDVLYVVDDVFQLYQVDFDPQQSFSFIRMSGESIWISPVFLPEQHFDFHRLCQRILKNQPMRYALSRENSSEIPEVPVKNISDAPLLFKIITETLGAQFKTEAKNTDRQLIAIDTLSQEIALHPIFWNGSHSAVCDDLINRNLNAPVLSSREGLKGADGGSRIVTPEKTLVGLRKLISPITGVINQFQELVTPYARDLKIYQTGFFKQPKLETLRAGKKLNEEIQQVCLGKGISAEQSKVSGLSEAIERRNALYVGDVLKMFHYKASELQASGKRFYEHQTLTPYSVQQYQDFATKDHAESHRKQAAELYQDEKIHWLPNRSLTHDDVVFLPLTTCQFQTGLSEERFGRWHSNGCSAGNCIEEAILQGLFELIERDATAIWWYNRIQRPSFDLDRLEPEHRICVHDSLSAHYDYWVLDLTNDVGVPVMAAIAQNKQTRGYVMGFGAHLNPETAAQRALTELCQLIPIRNQHSAPFDFDAMTEEAFLYPSASIKCSDLLIQNSKKQNNCLLNDIQMILAQLDKLGLEALLFDYTQSDTPLSTVKVTVPGLAHIWPQLANKRLYDVPVKLGWRKQVLVESELNAQALYI